MQEGAKDLVGGARIHVVRAQQEEALRRAAVLAHQVLHRRDRLLVRRGAGIEDVWRHLFTFVLNRVEQQAVQLLKHRQHGFARYRRPAAEDHRHLILADELTGFLGKQRPVRRRVNHHRLQFLAQHAAFGVDLINRHQGNVFQRRLGDRHRAGQRVHNSHFDGIGSLHAKTHSHRDHGGRQCKSF
jgi:hypothetical protein